MEAEINGMRAEINGLVEILESRSDTKQSSLRTLQLYRRSFVESVEECQDSDAVEDAEIRALYNENLRSAHQRYVRMLMKVLGMPLAQEVPASLLV